MLDEAHIQDSEEELISSNPATTVNFDRRDEMLIVDKLEQALSEHSANKTPLGRRKFLLHGRWKMSLSLVCLSPTSADMDILLDSAAAGTSLDLLLHFVIVLRLKEAGIVVTEEYRPVPRSRPYSFSKTLDFATHIERLKVHALGARQNVGDNGCDISMHINARLPMFGPYPTFLTSPVMLETIAASMQDGLWSDVCFVVRPIATSGHHCVYANSRMISSRCDYLRHKIKRHAFDCIDDALASGSTKTTVKNGASHEEQVGSSFPDAVDLTCRDSQSTVAHSIVGGSRKRARTADATGGHSIRRFSYVLIEAVSVTTFQRIVLWLQTGTIEFAKLSSESNIGNDFASDETYDETNDGDFDKISKNDGHDDEVPKAKTGDRLDANQECEIGFLSRDEFVGSVAAFPAPASVKSIYRAAVKFGLTSLAELALQELGVRLSPRNAIAELFNPFALNHPEAKQLIMEYTIKNWHLVKLQRHDGVAQILKKRLDVAGAEETLNQLLQQTMMMEGR
ncbi:hypothetical protein BCV70DRAFT_122814 [Testicularia cyperi]|uniref:Uncharacterized protein n=1 Tax=Testicularia cyperi TaxID=1882483 RepID=A0A317XL57_9BASI|nr:hypothetical protein BCV70DRAFT_122814 [Testicularia cyperi]